MQATLQPALSVGWLVGHTLFFFYDFISLTSLLLPKWSGNLKYGPCPPARDFGSRVSGLVFFYTVYLLVESRGIFTHEKLSPLTYQDICLLSLILV